MASQNPVELARHFSNAVITWKISNISLALCRPILNITSPDFSISGPTETSWRLNLRTSKDEKEQHIVILHLELLGDLAGSSNSESTSPAFKVRGFASNFKPTDKKSFINERELEFEERRTEVERINLIDVMQVLPQDKPDELNITCYILIDFDNKFNQRTSVPCGLLGLSNSLVQLPDKMCFPDWRVHVGSNVYHVHKDMLLRRGDGLKILINQHGSVGEVSIYDYDEFSVGSLFRYLYSGRLESILSTPRITTYSFIEHLQIPELQNVYPKEIINIESHVEGSDYVYDWEIEHFESVEEPISSPVFRHPGIDSLWQLHFYPKGAPHSNKQEKRFAFLQASLLHSAVSLDVCMEVRCINENGKILQSRRVHGTTTVGGTLEIPLFYRGGIYQKMFFIDRSLLLSFTIRITSGQIVRAVQSIQPSPSYYMTNNQLLVLFSRMMGTIFDNPEYHNFIIQHGSNCIPAHKFLLAARSPVLKTKLLEAEARGNSSFNFSNLKKNNLRVFLEFLYTGLMKDYSYETVMDMSDLARFHKMPDLEATARASSTLNSQNVLEIMMYEDERNLCRWKTQAFQLVGAIGETIKEHPTWKRLVHENPALAVDIMEFIKRTYVDFKEE